MDAAITAALASAARTIGKATTVDEALAHIVEAAKDSLPGFDQIGISTIDLHGHIETRAATGELVWDLDKLQYGLGEGPCVDSMHNGPIVMAPRIRHDPRWPRFVPKAVELGLKSQLAVKLYTDQEGTVGGLNIYSTISEDIDPDAPGVADMFASYAAVVLGKVKELDDLHQALRTRESIGKAIGLIMAKHNLDEDAAFGFLVQLSSHSNVKVRDIAARMVHNHSAEVTTRQQNG